MIPQNYLNKNVKVNIPDWKNFKLKNKSSTNIVQVYTDGTKDNLNGKTGYGIL